MRISAGIALAIAVGAVAVATPIVVSVRLARHESLEAEQRRVQGYTRDLVRRSDTAAQESFDADTALMQARLPECSAAEIALMRKLQISSRYLQMVARVSGDALVCTSLGTTEPIPVGPVDYVGGRGGQVRTNVRLAIGGGKLPSIVLSKFGFATVIQPLVPMDIATEGPDISIGVFRPEGGNLIGSKGAIRPEWLRALGGRNEATFLDHGFVVSIIRSQNFDYAAVSAAPPMYLERQVREFASIFVPIGLAGGFALAWAVLYLARASQSMPRVLRNAVRRGELFVEYQPIVELESGRWVGAEALVRWRRSNGDVILPDMFIPIAEQKGVIQAITETVAMTVAEDARELLRRDPDFLFTLNLSAVDLESEQTAGVLQRILEISGARAGNIMIEATERGFLHGDAPRAMVKRLRELGFRVAIDDFGTGYSSLSCLETLALDYLKIDKLFVETVGTDGATSQVVKHIIEMARSLRLEMIGEGVETEAQAEFLRQQSVRYAQGWFFARSMPVEALIAGVQQRQAVGVGGPA
jgi:sensor c-di-GMP phosphodiesterase-like protein